MFLLYYQVAIGLPNEAGVMSDPTPSGFTSSELGNTSIFRPTSKIKATVPLHCVLICPAVALLTWYFREIRFRAVISGYDNEPQRLLSGP